MDAVRGGTTEGSPPPATLEERDVLTEQLARLGAEGELIVYDAGCRAQRFALPSLRSSVGSGCAPRGAASPDGKRVARCADDETTVVDRSGGLVRTAPGCAPAWRPDGALTVAYEREVVRLLADCFGRDGCVEKLIPRRALERAARLNPSMPETPARIVVLVDGIAWMSPSRAAVQLSIRAGGRLAGLGALSQISFFERGRLTPARTYRRVTGGSIAASSRGTYVTRPPDVILRRDGSVVSLPPQLRDVRSFAWSSDERYLAVATRLAIHVLDVASLERFDETGFGLRSVTLPLSATDLAWR